MINLEALCSMGAQTGGWSAALPQRMLIPALSGRWAAIVHMPMGSLRIDRLLIPDTSLVAFYLACVGPAPVLFQVQVVDRIHLHHHLHHSSYLESLTHIGGQALAPA